MLDVDPRADRGTHKPHQRFGDAVKSQGRSWAEAVLQQAHHHAQQQAGRRIAPAERKVEGDEQREFQISGRADVHRKEGLQDQRYHHCAGHDAAVVFVHLDMRLGPETDFSGIHSLVLCCSNRDQRVLAGALAAAGGPVAGAGLASASFFTSTSCRVSSTSTSSRRSRCAAGFTRMRMKGDRWSGVASMTVPSGRSLGKMRSCPEVSSVSLAATFSSLLTYSNES